MTFAYLITRFLTTLLKKQNRWYPAFVTQQSLSVHWEMLIVCFIKDCGVVLAQSYKTFFIFKSAGHEIYFANKYQYINNFNIFPAEQS